jgi:uncharacterized protein (TIGR02466 family)
MLITFPTVIYKSKIDLNLEYRKNLDIKLELLKDQISYESNPWINTTKNTMGVLEPHKNQDFQEINSFIEEHVSRFCYQLRVRDHLNFVPKQSWINFYSINDYQESHYHPNFVFSAVFYYKTTSNTKIIFENPAIDMLPLEVDCQTDLNKQYLTIFPTSGDVLIFRSYLRHHVPKHIDNETKISFAYNFNSEN